MTCRRVVAGLLTAQAVAVVHVRTSNINHYEKVKSLLKAGFVAVPSPVAAESLKDWQAAFYGGMFFTFTVGLGLTLLSLPAVQWWRRSRDRSFPVRWGLILLWAGLIGMMNSNGVSAAAIAYALLIPTAVFAASIWDGNRLTGTSRSVEMIHLMGVLVLGGMGLLYADTALFSSVRDRLLLSNPVGIAINNFYYRYTLYPAQAFKSLDQDLIRTWRTISPDDDPTNNRLRPALARLDWLAIGGEGSSDMEMRIDRERLSLSRQGREVIAVSVGEFAACPGITLRMFSAETDRGIGLRRVAFASLMVIGLLTIYGTIYFPAHRIAGRCLGPVGAALAGVMIAAAASGLLLFWASGALGDKPSRATASKAMLKALLQADEATVRVKGLTFLYREKRGIHGLADARSIARSPDLLERYWLARVLAFDRSPDSVAVLVGLLDDHQINVACQACRSLGRRGDRRAVPHLLSVIHRSREWYVQLYAYRALRRLGWHQNGFN